MGHSPKAESRAARLLWDLYPDYDGFVRRREFSWSAEIVRPGQIGPPYWTSTVAEAGTAEELLALLTRLVGATKDPPPRNDGESVG